MERPAQDEAPTVLLEHLVVERLGWVLPPHHDARALLRLVLGELGLTAVESLDDLRAVGTALQRRGDEAAAFVGTLLVLHSRRPAP